MADLSSDMYYKHSGRKGFALPLILLIGIPVIIALSAAYSYIVVYCPVVGYVNVLFLGGYVFLGGVVLAFLAQFSKCRSPGMLALLGFFVGLVGLYFSWVFFIRALMGMQVQDLAGMPSVLDIAVSPMGVWAMAKEINAEGWWGPSGLAQWALVVVEALIMVLGITMFTSAAIDNEVFCEDCGTWCELFETMHMKPDPENPATDHLQILALEETDKSEYPRFDAEVLQCSGCKLTQAIRVKQVVQVMDDGELKEQEEYIPGILLQKKKTSL